MENSKTNKILLNPEQQNLLTSLPESGMGYQKVNLILKDGSILKDRLILNCMYLVLLENELFDVSTIDNIEISNPKKSGQ